MPYSPATAVVNANLPSTQAVFYDSVAVDALTANLAFQDLTTRKNIPSRSGRKIQFFMPDLAPFTASVAAGSTPPTATEGTVGTGLTPTQSSILATLGQYVDYISVGDLALEVAINPMLEDLAELLGYRGALVADTLVQMAFDAGVVTDATANYVINDGSVLTSNTLRAQVQSLEGRNARRFEDGLYHGVIHPFVLGDVMNDNSNNGMIDVLKRNPDGQKAIASQFADGSGNQAVVWEGVKWVTSTNVPLTAGPISGNGATIPAGKSGWSTYIAAKNAMFSVSLGKTDLPKQGNFNVMVKQFAPSVADPAGVIGGAVAYNFKMVVAPRPGTAMAFKRIQSETAIS